MKLKLITLAILLTLTSSIQARTHKSCLKKLVGNTRSSMNEDSIELEEAKLKITKIISNKKGGESQYLDLTTSRADSYVMGMLYESKDPDISAKNNIFYIHKYAYNFLYYTIYHRDKKFNL